MDAAFFLVLDGDGGADFGKVVEPLGVDIGEVDTTVAHGLAEVVVPVCAVERVALVEVQHPFHIREPVAGAAHGLGADFCANGEVALDGWGGG